MKKGIGKTISIIAILTMTFQLGMPIVPVLQKETFAADITTENLNITESKEISRNYEIKDEETWDISANGDGSVIAKWTLNDKTLTISGTGEMKDWNSNSEDWHNTQYNEIIEKVVINEGITNIGRYAFSDCTSLKSIIIPESVTNIKDSAFFRCSALKNITIPEGVISIGDATFSGCSSLESITIPESVTNIGQLTFGGCSSLKSITIPEGVTNIGQHAFSGCSSLKSINVDNNNKEYMSEKGILFNKEKTQIEKYPEGKKDTVKYDIPEGVTNIKERAFEGCSSLESITIPESVTSIGQIAFYGCSSLKSINIPEGVESIGIETFSGCSSLESITIPENITTIEIRAFKGCSSLKSITIPKKVTNIKGEAFIGCNSLESITIPESVTNIGEYAIPKTTVIYAKADSEGHRYAEEKGQGYILDGEATEISREYEIKEEETWDISANGDESLIAKWTLENKTLIISGTGEMKDGDIGKGESWHNTQYTNMIEKVVIEDGIKNKGDRAY